MDKLSAIGVFAKVVSTGSFAEAARASGLTRSAVSKAVSELETELGVRLFDRTTRSVSPTEAGQTYYQRCVQLLAMVEESDAEVASLQATPRGLLRINAPATFGEIYLAPVVGTFLQTYPDVGVDLVLTDRFIDPLKEGFDVTVRIGQLKDSSLIAKKIATAAVVLAASPAYLARAGEPQKAEDLMQHRCLVYRQDAAMTPWRIEEGSKTFSLQVPHSCSSNNGPVLAQWAQQGHGIALLPSFIIYNSLHNGVLKQVLPRSRIEQLAIYALYAPNPFLPAKTRLFIDFLNKTFSGIPPWERNNSEIV